MLAAHYHSLQGHLNQIELLLTLIITPVFLFQNIYCEKASFSHFAPFSKRYCLLEHIIQVLLKLLYTHSPAHTGVFTNVRPSKDISLTAC